jgi:LPS sulfotransferase NodH
MKRFLLATPRSGSTVVMDVLDQMGVPIPPKHAFFHAYNELTPHLREDGTLAAKPAPKTAHPPRWCDRVRLNTYEEMLRRIAIMRAAAPDYLFKFFPGHLDYGKTSTCSLAGPARETRLFNCCEDSTNPDFTARLVRHPIMTFLAEECEGVRLIRRDKRAQFYSMAKARHTNVFEVKTGNDLPADPKPFSIPYTDFALYAKEQVASVKIANLLNITKTIFYEDLSDDPTVITRAFGLAGTPAATTLQIQRTDYKWVSNPDEVEGWFSDWGSLIT